MNEGPGWVVCIGRLHDFETCLILNVPEESMDNGYRWERGSGYLEQKRFQKFSFTPALLLRCRISAQAAQR